MKKAKIIYAEINSKVDYETGESKSLEQRIVKTVNQEEFMQVYLEDISGLLKIESTTEFKVLLSVWRRSSFNKDGGGNSIILVKSIKNEIANDIGISEQTVSNMIPLLVKKELLIRKDRTHYILNPKFFFKGYSGDRFNVIKTILEYDIKKTNSDNENR